MDNRNLSLKIIAALFIISLIIRLFFIIKHGEIDIESDSYLHFLWSQAWIHWPHGYYNILINVWAKPLFTFISGIVLYSTVENIIVIKFMNTTIWIGSLYLIYIISKEHKLSREAIFFSIFFTSFSFLALRSSIGSLTEPLFTFLILAAYYFILRKNFVLSSILISLSFLCRMEGVIFIAIWAAYCFKNGKYTQLLILLIFPLLWMLASFLILGDALYIINGGYPLSSPYGRGDIHYYFLGLFKYEPIIFSLFLVSIPLFYKRFFCIKMCVISVLVFNIIIFNYGLLGSAGILRYFVPIIPFMSLLAAATLKELTERLRINNPVPGYLIFSVIILLQLIYTFALISGNGFDYMEYDSPHVNQELINSGIFIKSLDQNKPLYAEDPAIIYFSERVMFVNSFFSQPPVDTANIYYAYDIGFSKNNSGNKKIDYYLDNCALMHNFSDYVYLFEC